MAEKCPTAGGVWTLGGHIFHVFQGIIFCTQTTVICSLTSPLCKTPISFKLSEKIGFIAKRSLKWEFFPFVRNFDRLLVLHLSRKKKWKMCPPNVYTPPAVRHFSAISSRFISPNVPFRSGGKCRKRENSGVHISFFEIFETHNPSQKLPWSDKKVSSDLKQYFS